MTLEIDIFDISRGLQYSCQPGRLREEKQKERFIHTEVVQGRSQRSRIIIIGKITCWYTSESMQINQRRARASLETKQKWLHWLLLHIDSKTYRIGQEGSNTAGTDQRLVHALWIFESSAKQRRNRQNTGPPASSAWPDTLARTLPAPY